MLTKDKQIAQEAVQRLAETLAITCHRMSLGSRQDAIEAELHRALDPLLEAARGYLEGESRERFAEELGKWIKLK